MKKLTISIAKKLGYVGAVLVIIAALLVIFTRIYIPALDKHRPDFEQMASQILGAPVTIKKARFAWYQYQPELTLYNLTLYDNHTKMPALHLRKLRIFFSLPKSLWERKIVLSGVMLTGAEINIEQKASGELVAKELQQLEDMPDVDKAATVETKVIEMLGWLMAQPRISLSDVDIHYTGYRGQKRYVTFNNLRFENNGDKHVVLARAILHQDIPTEVSLVLQGVGNVSQLNDMKVHGYVYFSGLSLLQWSKNISWHGWEIRNGLGSAKIWFDWSNGALQKVQSIFQVYGLQIASAYSKDIYNINRLSADVGWKRDGRQQIFAADDVLLDMQDHLWPVTNFYMLMQPDQQGALQLKTISMGYLNIDDVSAVLNGLGGIVPSNIKDTIRHFQPSGAVNNISISFPDRSVDWQQAAFKATLSHVSINSYNGYPGIRNLSGEFTLDKNTGKASIDSKNIVLDANSLFTQPLFFNELNAELSVEHHDRHWLINAAAIKVVNPDLDFSATGSLRIEGDNSPYLDLEGKVKVRDATRVYRYLPLRVFSSGLAAWLKSAFLQGHADNGTAMLHGRLTDFPFSNNNGTFRIAADVDDVTLKFAPDWPEIRSIKGKVEFVGNKVNINVSNANISGINTGVITGYIPALSGDLPTILQVDAREIPTDFALALQFVQQSPLRTTIGKIFKDMDVRGPILLDLGLIVPFADTDKTSVDGVVTLNKVNMNVVPWRFQLADVNGQVHFTENTTDAEQLNAYLFDKPISLSLKTMNQGKANSFLRASTITNLAIKDLQDWLNIPFSNVISGAANVSANVDLSFDQPVNIHLASDLQGAEIKLPAPYAKASSEKKNFTSDIAIPGNKPLRIRLDYAELLNVALTVNSRQDAFQLLGVDLRLGKGEAAWPAGAGLYVTGNIPRLDMSDIKKYAAQTDAPLIPGLDLKSIDVNVGSVQLLSQDLDNVRLQISPVNTGWKMVVTNDDVSGQIMLPFKMSSRSKITAVFDKLDLDVNDKNTPESDVLDVRSFPSIDFKASDMDINGMLLGQVAFNLVPSLKGMEIRALTIHSPNMSLQASGDWLVSGRSSTTELSGVLASQNVSQMLHQLTYTIDNFVASRGTLKFDLSWPAAPFTPVLSQLSGEAALDMGRGRIVDVGQENDAKMDIGKMLSLFSLQSIPRRLSLDFSDLVEKGYSFDTLKGNFRLSSGNIYTSNTQFDGPVASIGIKGRIGVDSKDVDMTLSVTPHVAASLPIAATLIGGPVAGIASLAVNSVVSAAVSSVATHQYLVKGPWNNPEWSTVEPEKPLLQKRR